MKTDFASSFQRQIAHFYALLLVRRVSSSSHIHTIENPIIESAKFSSNGLIIMLLHATTLVQTRFGWYDELILKTVFSFLMEERSLYLRPKMQKIDAFWCISQYRFSLYCHRVCVFYAFVAAIYLNPNGYAHKSMVKSEQAFRIRI